MVTLIGYQLRDEVKQYRVSVFAYLSDFWNLVILLDYSLSLASLVLFAFLSGDSSEGYVLWLLFVSCVASALTWFYLLYWFRLNRRLNLFIVLLVRVIKTAREVVIVLLVIFAMFGAQMHILDAYVETVAGERLFSGYLFERSSFVDVVLQQFFEMMQMANSFDAIADMELTFAGTRLPAYALKVFFLLNFAATTFLTNFIILNMIIAIMGEALNRTYAKERLARFSEVQDIMQDYQHCIQLHKNEFMRHPYAYVLSEIKITTDADSDADSTQSQEQPQSAS